MQILIADKKDLIEIAKCHQKAFPKSLLSYLGISSVAKVLEWYLTNERGIIYCLKDSENIIKGYFCGIITIDQNLIGANSSTFNYAKATLTISFLKKPWLLFHPEIFSKIKNFLAFSPINFLKVFYKKRFKKFDKENFIPFIGLVIIGVKEKGLGYGSLLLKEFENISRTIPMIKKLQLSVKTENRRAIKVYLNNGWEVEKSEKTYFKLYKVL
ncbi:MAG: hypothetical protein JJ844_01045 [Prochlorococcus marinus CUG1435]|nr:hypothetical protein [Prochlorococcus marinus CUG1435]